MRLRGKLLRLFLALIVLVSLSCNRESRGKPVKEGSTDHYEECIVEKVIDGDTIVCSGKRVRLIGIDAPESTINPHIEKQRSLGDVETIIKIGKIAKKFVKNLMPVGTRVKLEYDVEKYDKYGRVLAYVWLPNGEMANEVIVREGYAMLLTIPPNVKYEKRLKKAFKRAVEERRGLWGM
ncbi:MAG: thermonuclease family protein [Thermosulfidibacteraceae bacterium]|mgnify:CR=1 FL=1|jgi:micrococcal nuclease